MGFLKRVELSGLLANFSPEFYIEVGLGPIKVSLNRE